VGILKPIGILIAAALLVPAASAQAMTAQTSGWSPLNPPTDPTLFEAEFPGILYSLTCGSVTATGWSAEFADDTVSVWNTMLITSSEISTGCADRPGDLVVRQGDDTYAARIWNSDPSIGLAVILLEGDATYIDWDFIPMPRVGQWVGIDARSADGSPLPMLERRVVAVGEDTFTLDQAIGPEYVGAPVVDNMARALGVVLNAGTVVTGTPPLCNVLAICTDASKVWWDITAPSRPRAVKATAGKGRVTVTWKPAANDGGAEVAYWYSVNGGPWVYSEKFSMTRKARSGRLVMVTVQTINAAGPGPAVTVSRMAK